MDNTSVEQVYRSSTSQQNRMNQKKRPRRRRRRPPDINYYVIGPSAITVFLQNAVLLFLLLSSPTTSIGSITQEDANLTLANSPVLTNLSHLHHQHQNHQHHSHHSHQLHHTHHHTHPHHHNESSTVLPSILSSTTTSTITGAGGVGEDDSSLPLLPSIQEGSSSSLSNQQRTFDHTIHNMDKNNPKGLKFEEEPSDSYIVRSKSAILRCRTLNALNAWFTCNSGDERRIQANQKISNYVDPQTGIRLIEIDLEITRSDVEEHQNSGYTNPFECWCTAYGGHHQIMSRKASVSFAYLKKHFPLEPKSISISLSETTSNNNNGGGKTVEFKCRPPFGVPEPVVFWMRNDVIILENEPKTINSNSSSSHKSTDSSHKPHYFTEKFLRNKKNFSLIKSNNNNKKLNKTISKVQKRMAASISTGKKEDEDVVDDEDYEDDDEDEDDEDLEYDASKQPEKEIGSGEEQDDQDDDQDGDLLLPHHFDLAANNHPKGKDIPINYHMTDDHSLVIKHVTIDDQANYTCGVYNVAGVRFTKPASLTVFVNGEWSSWGSWSPCQLAPGLTAQGMKCGIGTQKRVRHCNNPAPVNNGQFCPGESVQVAECTILCPPIDGFWSPWTQWSTCSHDCTQIRRRICNNPVPQYGGHDCFGSDFIVKNCTGGLCRKTLFSSADSTNFMQHPIGPTSGVSSSSSSSSNNDQIYFIIIFILILIILTFIIYILMRYQLHRRRHGAKSSFHHLAWLNNVDSDHLSHTSCPIDATGAGEDPASLAGASAGPIPPTLLLLQQQQDGRFYNKPIKGSLLNGCGGGAGGGTSPHPMNHYPLEPISVSAKTTPAKHQYHLAARLNQQGVDHFLVQSTAASPHSSHIPKCAPLPTIPRDEDSVSMVSSSNRYEEPQFRSPQASNRSLSIGSTQQNNNNKKPINIDGPGTNSSSGSANTTSTTANELSNESEPDYAEPIINNEQIHHLSPPNTPAPPLPSVSPPSTSIQSPNRYPIGEGSSLSEANSSSSSSDGVGVLCGRHEKFVKITQDIARYGHYSAMPNLGVALYLPPGFLVPPSTRHHQLNSSTGGGVAAGTDLYIRYGIDTRARYPGLCSLSSVITLNFSSSSSSANKNNQQELNRPVIVCFRHCLSFKSKTQIDTSLLNNLVILWQQNDHHQQLSHHQKQQQQWLELIRYGKQTDPNCYLHLDSTHCYLITKLFGRFMFGFRPDLLAKNTSFNINDTDSPLMSAVHGSMGRAATSSSSSSLAKEMPLVKLVNFSITIEQFNPNEHLIKCYIYDNLPSSVLMFRNDHLPGSPAPSTLVNVMIGRMIPLSAAYNSSLKLSITPTLSHQQQQHTNRNNNSTICFELQTSSRLVKAGSRRMEIPMDHFCWLGPNSMLHCSWVTVANNNNNNNDNNIILDNEEMVDDTADDDDSLTASDYDNNDNDDGDEDSSSPTYQNNLRILRSAKSLDYAIKVWQQKPELIRKRSHLHQMTENCITLNRLNMTRLNRLPGNMQHFYQEECCRLFGDSELEIRRTMIEQLDRCGDSGGWRQWAAIVCQFDPYLISYFGQQKLSPSHQLMELWESKTITELAGDGTTTNSNSSSNNNSNRNNRKRGKYDSNNQSAAAAAMMLNPMKIKELFYAKLMHQLQTIRRSDLVDLILGHHF